MGYDQHTVHDTSFQFQFCCLPLVLANIRPWPLMAFFQISLKNSELKTTHNAFQDCHVNFFQQPFSKQLYMTTITVNLISSMDRALHLVITKVRVQFLVKLKLFSGSFSITQVVHSTAKIIFTFTSLSAVQNMIHFI